MPPITAYGALLVDGILLTQRPEILLFAIGATALLLLFIGIHNAGDSVTHIAFQRRRQEQAVDYASPDPSVLGLDAIISAPYDFGTKAQS